MTREEIRKNIEYGDGKWEPEPGFVFTLDPEPNDQTINCHWSRPNTGDMWAFSMEHNGDDIGGFHLANHTSISDIGALNEFAAKLAAHLEYELAVPGVQTIERVVEIADTSAVERLAGKVEAYENILIGRSITAS